jgi:hypothetical protein
MVAGSGHSPLQQLAWLQSLRHPELALGWTLAEWERVVRVARRLRLLARLAEALDDSGLQDQVPEQPRRHLVAEQRLSRWRTSAVLWTAERVAAAFAGAPYPRVLLKGAAYVAQQLSIASGRLPSDLDVLVPRESIVDAQERLALAGWQSKALNAHDRRYYHEWSHEVPPMSHPLYLAELDLHHNILPPVARTRVDAGLLLSQVVQTSFSGWNVLSPEDQVLHSAAHLFFDSDLEDRMRDLVDLDGLIRHFSVAPDFNRRLTERSLELGLQFPLALAFHFCIRWLATPVPQEVAETIVSRGPGPLQRAWLIPLLERALLPSEPDMSEPRMKRIAAGALRVRHHLWRMPLRLLVPHVIHKIQHGSRRDVPEQPMEE